MRSLRTVREVLSAVAALSLASCGGGDEGTGDLSTSAPSMETQPDTDTPPVDVAPTSVNLSADAVSPMEVILSWDGSWPWGSQFRIFRRMDGWMPQEIQEVPASQRTYFDKGRLAGKTYSYRLNLGNETYSSWVKVTTPFPNIAAGEYHTLYLEGGKTVRALGKYADPTVDLALNQTFDTDVIAIAAGAEYSLALTEEGNLWAWGRWNQNGFSSTPYKIAENVVAIAGGLWHSLAVTEDGKVWTSGRNVWGTDIDSSAVGSSCLSHIIAVAAGNGHSLALTNDWKVKAWGCNTWGQLGDGSSNYRSLPVPVTMGDQVALYPVVAVAAGYDHSLALKADGTVWAWGNHGFSADGSYGSSRRAIQVTDLTDVCAVAAFGFHSVVLKKDGTVWTWGLNNAGALGTGSSAPAWSSIPIPLSISGATAIAAGYYHTLAKTEDGKVWGWGSGAQGQLSTSLANDQPPLVIAP